MWHLGARLTTLLLLRACLQAAAYPDKNVEIQSCCVTQDNDGGLARGGCRVNYVPGSRRPVEYYVSDYDTPHVSDYDTPYVSCTWSLNGETGQFYAGTISDESMYTEYGTVYRTFLCSFAASVPDLKPNSTFSVRVNPGYLENHSIPLNPTCIWEKRRCGEGLLSCDGNKCLEDWSVCNGWPDCADGKDESPERCYGTNKSVEILSCCVTQTGRRVQGGCSMADFSQSNDAYYSRYSSSYYEYSTCSWALEDEQNVTMYTGWKRDQFVCTFDQNLPQLAPDSTFEMVTGNRAIRNIPLRHSCSLPCPDDMVACDGFRCLGKWSACNHWTDCTDGKDESFEVCHWWCALDKTGDTCVILLATIPSVAVLVVLRVLLCRYRPSKTRGRWMEKRKPSDDAVDKYETVALWVKSFFYYICCCCCKLRVPSRAKGRVLEEREIPQDPADDKFEAAGRFVSKNGREIAGLWLKCWLYYICCCCRLIVPSKKNGKFLEVREIPDNPADDKFEAARRFARKNWTEIAGLWFKCLLYYIFCCCFGRKKAASASESPYCVLVPAQQTEEVFKVPTPQAMDMAKSGREQSVAEDSKKTTRDDSELAKQLMQYIEDV